jgi:hypothetical protein
LSRLLSLSRIQNPGRAAGVLVPPRSSSGAFVAFPPQSPEQSAAASNMPSPTTGRSAANTANSDFGRFNDFPFSSLASVPLARHHLTENQAGFSYKFTPFAPAPVVAKYWFGLFRHQLFSCTTNQNPAARAGFLVLARQALWRFRQLSVASPPQCLG